MINLQNVQDRNYNAQLRRGKITKETDVATCICDLAGEVLELFDECGCSDDGSCSGVIKDIDKFKEESADVLLNLLTVLKIGGVSVGDFMLSVKSKLEYNEIRKD